MLPRLTRTEESTMRTEAVRRKARAAGRHTTMNDAPVSPKRRITSWFTAPAASSS